MRKTTSLFLLLFVSVSVFSQVAIKDNRKHFAYADTKFEPGSVKVYHNIYFGVEEPVLRPESFPVLDSIADFLYYHPELFVEIGAHTDGIGTESYNAKFSKSRAQAVYQYLVKQGIPNVRLAVMGYGESLPIAANEKNGLDYPEGRAVNRRIEMKVTYLFYPPEKILKPVLSLQEPTLIHALFGDDCSPMQLNFLQVRTIEEIIDTKTFMDQEFYTTYKEQERNYLGYTDGNGNQWVMASLTYKSPSKVLQNAQLNSRKLLSSSLTLYINLNEGTCYQGTTGPDNSMR